MSRRAVAWSLGLLAGLGLALLLTPPVFAALRGLGWLGEDDFPKVLRRMLLVPFVVVLVFGVRPWRHGSLASYGLLGETARPRAGLTAAAIALGVGVAILAWHFAAGWLRFEDPIRWGELGRRVLHRTFAAPLIATLEEWFFRGWLFRVATLRHSPLVAALLVAAGYSLVHAFQPTSLAVDVTPDVAGAWAALGAWFGRLGAPSHFAATLLGLFLLGLLLQAVYLRTRTLWAPIGVHAAGIFVLHVYGSVTERHPERTWAGTKWLIDGPPVWALFLLLTIALWPRRKALPSTG